jgi:GNAT superfamily N-acetyltransferase
MSFEIYRVDTAEAAMEDYDRWGEVVVGMYAESNYKGSKLNTTKAKATLAVWAESPKHLLVGARLEGVPVGFLIGQLFSTWFGDDIFAKDILVFVPDPHRKNGIAMALYQHFFRWAYHEGAVAGYLSTSTGIGTEAAKHIFENKLGLRQHAHTYKGDM